MENTELNLEKNLNYMIYGSLLVLAIGLLTSPTLLALSHLLIIFPALYFIRKTNFRKMPKSSWALLILTIILVCSVVFNQDVAIKGYKPITKTKYFLIGFLSILPYSWYLKKYLTPKLTSSLIYTFCLTATLASLAGMIAMKTQFNYVSWRVVSPFRNSGLFGMGMNYAHNIAYFLIILLGLIVNRKKLNNIVNTKLLYLFFSLNFLGLYFTYTRGALLALFTAAPFYFFKKSKKHFLSVALILCLVGFGTYYIAGDSIIRPNSDVQRLSQWRAAIKAFSERPVLGYGYLNFEEHVTEIKKRYNLPEPDFGGHAHNNFLEILATSGILGFVAFGLWIYFWIVELYRRDDAIASIGVPFIVVFIVGGLTQSTIGLGINLFFIMAAYSLSTASSEIVLSQGSS